jgi:predicted ester cyclase
MTNRRDDIAAVVRETFGAVFRGEASPFEHHPGLYALRMAFPPMLAAFPDFSAELVRQLVDGCDVATHWIFRGTHAGELYGIRPTGKAVQFQNISICRVEAGRIMQYNSEIGWMSLLKQIDAWPPVGPRGFASALPASR